MSGSPLILVSVVTLQVDVLDKLMMEEKKIRRGKEFVKQEGRAPTCVHIYSYWFSVCFLILTEKNYYVFFHTVVISVHICLMFFFFS